MSLQSIPSQKSRVCCSRFLKERSRGRKRFRFLSFFRPSGAVFYGVAFGLLGTEAVLAQRFTDVAEQSGLSWPGTLWRDEMLNTAIIDYDNDGDFDIWTAPHRWSQANTRQRPALWRQESNGQFTHIHLSEIYVSDGDKHGTVWFDYDNDGDLEFYVNTGGLAGRVPPQQHHQGLYRNDGNGVFTDIGSAVGLSPSIGSGRGNVVFDWNGDGLLDLIQFNADVSGQGPYSRLYMQLPNGQFGLQDASSGFGIPGDAFFGLVADLFGDGMPDLLCFDGEANSLGFLARAYEIEVPLIDRSEELPEDIRIPRQNLRDVVVADFNGDLIADIIAVQVPDYNGSVSTEEELPGEITDQKLPPLYLLSTEAGGYEVVEDAGLLPYFGMSVGAGDFDNDGDPDLIMTGQVGQITIQPRYFENQGDGSFVEISGANGLARTVLGPVRKYDQAAGMGFVIGDINGDGYLDVYAPPQVSPPTNGAMSIDAAYFLNGGGSNHWLQLDLEGTISSRDAIGAKVFVTAAGRTQLREVTGGQRRQGQDPKRVHFGLGTATVVDRILVHWPSGQVNLLTGLAANQIRVLTESEPYEAWASGYDWPVPEDGQPLEDPNQDSIANLMAYAADLEPLGLNPLNPIVAFSGNGVESSVGLVYRRAAGGAPGVIYEILESEDLGEADEWTPVDFNATGNSQVILSVDPDGDNTAEHVAVRVALAGREQLFLRLSVRLDESAP